MLPGAVFARRYLESRVKDLMERLARDLPSDDDRFLLALWRDDQNGTAVQLRKLLNLLNRKEKTTMPNVQFPASEPIFTQNTTVAFDVLIDGVRATGEISEEALQDHFGAATGAGVELVRAFKANRHAIEAVARVKLPAKYAAGRGLLVSADF